MGSRCSDCPARPPCTRFIKGRAAFITAAGSASSALGVHAAISGVVPRLGRGGGVVVTGGGRGGGG